MHDLFFYSNLNFGKLPFITYPREVVIVSYNFESLRFSCTLNQENRILSSSKKSMQIISSLHASNIFTFFLTSLPIITSNIPILDSLLFAWLHLCGLFYAILYIGGTIFPFVICLLCNPFYNRCYRILLSIFQVVMQLLIQLLMLVII